MNRLEFLERYRYKTELHAHTSPVSRCSFITPRELAQNYAAIGAQVVVITNHLHPDWMQGDPAQRAEQYLSDYYEALEEGKRCGVNVILGAEVRFTENSNDYLVYGIEPSDIEKMIAFLDRGIEEFYAAFKNSENLILQAHPFRKNMVLAPISAIDGIEVFNLHPAHNSKIALAARYARDNKLLVCGGTDYHDPGDQGLCLMRSSILPRDSFDIAKILLSRDYLFDVSGNLILIE